MKQTTEKYIYCIEGNWNGHPKSKQTIKPILDILYTFSNIKYIHHKCKTKEDFFFYLHKFISKQYKNYPILYIAFHGRTNRICIGNDTITLKEIANAIEGNLKGKIIHFGSCSTLRTSEKNLSNFIAKTNCDFISGYKKDVDYIKASAFELIYFDLLQKFDFIRKIQRFKYSNNLVYGKLKFMITFN